jgi:Flp pilus assembly protein TadD
MNVEPAAWISSRKDVLSLLWGMLAFHSWLSWKETGGRALRTRTCMIYALAVLSKPMMITLPALWLVMDFSGVHELRKNGAGFIKNSLRDYWPYAVIGITITLTTFWGGGPDVVRIGYQKDWARAIGHYGYYMSELFWPHNLGMKNPFQPMIYSAGNLALGGAAILVSAGTLLFRKKWPILFLGAYWFLITLIPITGMLQPGDRFFYLPGLGLLVAFGSIFISAGRYRKFTAFVLAILLLGFSTRSWAHVRTWMSNESYYQHALQVNPQNTLALNNLAAEHLQKERYAQADRFIEQVLQLDPNNAMAHSNRGLILAHQGEAQRALESYLKGAHLDPKAPEIASNLGDAYTRMGKYALAHDWYDRALELRPLDAECYYDKGNAYLHERKPLLASVEYKKALALRPRAEYYNNLAQAQIMTGDWVNAKDHLLKALDLDPEHENSVKTLKQYFQKE